MKVAIIGAGLSGLSIATYLLRKNSSVSITVFDHKGIGQGASRLASLLHPYPGKNGRRSLYSQIALTTAKELFEFIEPFTAHPFLSPGILRSAYTLKQQHNFIAMGKFYGDVDLYQYDLSFFHISSGFTVNTAEYLQSLWRFCVDRNANLIKEKIVSVHELDNFDHIVLAVGAGIQSFNTMHDHSFDFVKGQILYSNIKSICHIPMSCVAKGYIAQVPNSPIQLGSTYEHHFTHEEFLLKEAKETIIGQLATYFPWIEELPIDSGRAAIRVCNKGSYLPIFDTIRPGLWMMAGMGSRGLLYHAIMGLRAAEQILNKGVDHAR